MAARRVVYNARERNRPFAAPPPPMSGHQNRSCRPAHGHRGFRGRRRGVSDMVAVILALAITVILAAVLYIVIINLSHTSGSAPLGSEFAWGAPSNDTSTAASACSAGGHYCYHVEMVVTGRSVNVDQFLLALQTPTGTPVGWPTSVTATGGTITVISPTTGSVVAQYWPLNGSWQILSPFTGVLGNGFSLVIFCGGAAEGANQGLWGLELVAVGTNGYSGTVPSALFY